MARSTSSSGNNQQKPSSSLRKVVTTNNSKSKDNTAAAAAAKKLNKLKVGNVKKKSTINVSSNSKSSNNNQQNLKQKQSKVVVTSHRSNGQLVKVKSTNNNNGNGSDKKQLKVNGNSISSPPSQAKVKIFNKVKGSNNKVENSHQQQSKSKSTNSSSASTSTTAIMDRSQINIPYDIRAGSFGALQNTIKNSTPRVKQILANECDLILECKVCSNLFRAIPNFISHKQAYCTKKHQSPISGYSQYIQNSDDTFELQYLLDPSIVKALNYLKTLTPPSSEAIRTSPPPSQTQIQEQPQSSLASELVINQDDKSERLAKVLSKIKTNKLYVPTAPGSPSSAAKIVDAERQANINMVISTLKPEGIERLSDGIVYQKLIDPKSDPSVCDKNYNRNRQLDHMLLHNNADSAVLGPDGKVIYIGQEGVVENLIDTIMKQINEKNDKMHQKDMELNCSECNCMFESKTSLRNHIRETHIFENPKRFRMLDQDQISTTSSKSTNDKTFSNIQSPMRAKKRPGRPISSKTNITFKKSSLAVENQDRPAESENEGDDEMNSNEFSEDELSCRCCSENFIDKEELSKHIARSHGIVDDALFNPTVETPTSTISILERYSYANPTNIVNKIQKTNLSLAISSTEIKKKNGIIQSINKAPNDESEERVKRVEKKQLGNLLLPEIETDLIGIGGSGGDSGVSDSGVSEELSTNSKISNTATELSLPKTKKRQRKNNGPKARKQLVPVKKE